MRCLSLLLLCVGALGGVRAGPKLVVILVDGVRWDYLSDPKLKSFHRMAEEGVRARYLQPVYPSLTYPNMYSLVTGLYPENQGFLSNNMFDQETGSFYHGVSDPNSTDPMWWNEAEPIWITAEKNDLRAALYWWGGCEVRIRGRHPTICERERYGPPTPEEREDFFERIDDIVEMFKPSKRFPQDRLSLVLMYYGPTDYNGHEFGPRTREVREALYDFDTILGRLQSKLDKAGLKEEVNIMVVSDHGMNHDPNLKYVSLQQFAPDIKLQVSSGTESMIVPQDGALEKLYRAMGGLSGVRVYKREDIPSRYHVRGSRRMTPLYLVAEKGHYIRWLDDPTKNKTGPSSDHKGHHGYDPMEVEDMRAIFLASGPAFRSGFQVEALNNTDLYNVMSRVLQIEPLPNNGSWEKASSIMRKPSTHTAHKSSSDHLHSFFHFALAILLSLMFTSKTV